jgi:Tfp pilus assembly protein PilN
MITINFASRNYRQVGKVRSGLHAGSVILAVLMALMLWNIASFRSDLPAMDRTLRELEETDKQARLALQEREQLVKDLNAMSGLMESRKISWTGLLTSIESVVPKGVALNHVSFNPKDSSLSLDGVALSPESLRNLVVGLEKTASFKDPFLKHQSLEKGSISFNVVAVYLENTRPAVAQGKR